MGVGGGRERVRSKPSPPSKERVAPKVGGEREIKEKREVRITFFYVFIICLTSFLVEKTKKKEKKKEMKTKKTRGSFRRRIMKMEEVSGRGERVGKEKIKGSKKKFEEGKGDNNWEGEDKN